jgi:succinoglycan biosynthesis protein ExoM
MSSTAVCIPTYRRAQYLEDLLTSLTELDRNGISTHVVVVDNDVSGSAQSVVERFAGTLPGLVYEVEPERGISAARNRLVRIAARLGVDYVAFVDDDERVHPAWLSALIRTADEYAADAVGGPVLPEFDADVPSWIQNGGLFERPRYPTGTRVELIRTGNLLVKREWLERVEGPFDRLRDLTGGADGLLLRTLGTLGANMVWCDEAVAYEKVPARRGNLSWFLKRRFRIGTTWYVKQWPDIPQPLRFAAQACRAVTRILYGGGAIVTGAFRGRAGIALGLGHCAMGVGGLLGLLGVRYRFYRNPDGR